MFSSMAKDDVSAYDRKLFLNKNKSVKIFREKQKKRDAYIQRRENLRALHNQIDVSKIEKFDNFPLTNETRRGLKKCGYLVPTEIQLETIGLALKGHDILGAAKTGSGKTLAFVVPILERLFCEGWCRSDGLGVLVITPTRELALQIYKVCCSVGSFHDFTIGLVIGGKGLKEERKILNLYNIVICTPGRLLQHMDENPLFDAINLQMLVLDEADRILDLGFQKDMNAIIENLPENRQTLLFSATQTKSVSNLARLSLKDPVYVSVHENAAHATPESLEQSYIVCELHRKMDFLWSFIKNHLKQKIIVFMASCKQVKYTFDVFCRMKPGVSLMALYGDLHQKRRIERYEEFCRKNFVVMFATDLAARGLDFPNVNWVVQLDCPEDTDTYIHRAGRTARYQKGGESLLVLLPSEKESMVDQLQKRKIPINEIKVHPKKLMSVQRKMEALCARDENLKESAKRAFKSYYKNIFLMKDKSVFDIKYLDQKEVRESYAISLGLASAPRIRFVEKRLKATSVAETSNEKDSVSSVPEQKKYEEDYEETLGNFSSGDEESDDEFMKPRKAEISSESDNAESDDDRKPAAVNDEEIESELASTSKKKPLTKAAVAKRILKKNIKPNVKVVFDEEGQIVEDIPKAIKDEVADKLLKEMAEEGYSLEKAKMIMEEEDKVDKELFLRRIKQKHKEKRLKLKQQRRESDKGSAAQLAPDNNEPVEEEDGKEDGDESSGSEVDPNKFMRSGSESSENDEVSVDEDEDMHTTENITRKRKFSDSSEGSTNHSRNKRPSKTEPEKLSLDDEEALALHLLTSS